MAMLEPLISSDSTSDLKIKDSSGIYPHQFLQKLEQSASTAQLKVMTGQQTAVGFSRANHNSLSLIFAMFSN